MDLQQLGGGQPQVVMDQAGLHILHQPHQNVDLMQHVAHELPQQQIHQELQQPVHLVQQQQQPVIVVVDHSQAVRAKLEELAYQLHNMNNSEQFQRRFHLASNWRLSEKNQASYIKPISTLLIYANYEGLVMSCVENRL